MGALTLLHHGAATRFDPTGELFNALIAEGEAVAAALGVKLDGDPRQLVQKGANAPGKHMASMLQDVIARRQLPLGKLISGYCTLEQTPDVMTRIAKGQLQPIKMIIR